MAIDAQVQQTRSRHYRIGVSQYHKMMSAGVFPETARIELLGGQLVEKMTKDPAHHLVVGRLGRMFGHILSDPWFVSEEKPVKLGQFWYPEPDIAVVRGPDHRFEATTSTAADLGLIIEVSDSSYHLDRGRKWKLYAAAGIPY